MKGCNVGRRHDLSAAVVHKRRCLQEESPLSPLATSSFGDHIRETQIVLFLHVCDNKMLQARGLHLWITWQIIRCIFIGRTVQGNDLLGRYDKPTKEVCVQNPIETCVLCGDEGCVNLPFSRMLLHLTAN